MVEKMIENEIYLHPTYKKWWPKFDHNPDGNFKTIMSGIGAIDLVFEHSKDFKLCIQAGGHLGFWPNKLAERYKAVYTFEADPIVFECLARNVKREIFAYQQAIGAERKIVQMQRGRSAGGTREGLGGDLLVNQITIDSLDLNACDAILLDIEGGELSALKGAINTIEQFSPVILVEELAQHKDALQEYLQYFGYTRAVTYGRDGIWTRL